jgi:hypothetical protein
MPYASAIGPELHNGRAICELVFVLGDTNAIRFAVVERGHTLKCDSDREHLFQPFQCRAYELRAYSKVLSARQSGCSEDNE